MFKLNGINRSVLIISDLHIPYMHRDWLRFLTAIKDKILNSKSIIINIGDEVDNHGISFHQTDVDLFSAGHELSLAIEKLSHLNKLFPKMFLCTSNHGSLAIRRAKSDGLPIRYYKELKDVYKTPKWEWHDEILLTTKHKHQTYICHGKRSGHDALAKDMGMNAIQGHFHGKAAITWTRTATMWRYSMFTGCLINYDSMAFHYGKNHIPKPILSVGYIDKSGMPYLIFMNLDEEGNWDGRLPIFGG